MPRWSAADIPDQSGRTALVTGAGGGLGLRVALHLAQRGCRVLMAVRDTTRGEAALDLLRAQVPGAAAELVEVDLADLESVRKGAAEAAERTDALDLLVDNAGVMAVPRRTLSAQGFELQLATNHLGHFALTGLLLPLLEAAPSARVVAVSSIMHKSGRLDFTDLQAERRYSPMTAYNAAKLANAVFAVEFQRRLGAAGSPVIAVGAHPGVATTELGRKGSRLGGGGTLGALFDAFAQIAGHSAEAGALPLLRAATDPGVRGGEYYGPAGLGGLRGAPVSCAYHRRAYDPETGRRLWAESERLTNVTYDLPPAPSGGPAGPS
ncbi:short-chain dehydrogenase [Nocardiopsis ansamitocini]|uniref:Short-chain dehydrogenase n=2 Tax=Nocardiopsis ansamitocini TaxID=1670832 RepID=A0A9W6PB54_9ACTN|nr:short-chain dehydrogenase [Nocardiopsis ansamitocini]